jgi:hypothetical protein
MDIKHIKFTCKMLHIGSRPLSSLSCGEGRGRREEVGGKREVAGRKTEDGGGRTEDGGGGEKEDRRSERGEVRGGNEGAHTRDRQTDRQLR